MARYRLLTHLDGTDEIFNLTLVEGDTTDELEEALRELYGPDEPDEDEDPEEFLDSIMVCPLGFTADAEDIIACHEDSTIVIPEDDFIPWLDWKERGWR